MNPDEYRKLFSVEKEHWFYAGKRELAHHWISRLFGRSGPKTHLDVGAGSGMLVQEMSGSCASVGVEFSTQALQSGLKIKLLQASISNLPFRDGHFDCVTCFDVLEHVDDDSRALSELIRVTRPGGILLINVPAFRILWSDWDVALHHKRRYHKNELLNLFRNQPVEIAHLFHTNAFLFLPVLIYRFFRTYFGGRSRLEDQIPPPWINAFLKKLFVLPAKRGWSMLPWGTSLFAILRKC